MFLGVACVELFFGGELVQNDSDAPHRPDSMDAKAAILDEWVRSAGFLPQRSGVATSRFSMSSCLPRATSLF